MKNALTIDVEDYFQVSALEPSIPRSTWDSCEYRVEASTERLLEIFERARVKGTFFVLGWVAERSPQLVRRIAAAGHEVACHGYAHRRVYTQSVEEFRRETAATKMLLEDLCGTEVIGYRAASFSIVSRSLWALDVLLDLGFRYDSSVFPIRHDLYGIPDAERAPGLIAAPSGRGLAEFPMATARWLGQTVPVSGGGYFRILPYWLTRAGLRQVNARGLPFTFYLHPWEIDPDQPRAAARGFARFRHYTNLAGCEQRLVSLLRDFEFTRMVDVLVTLGLMPEGGRRPLEPAAAAPWDERLLSIKTA
jgi:polysaccharide deacetylase family protein (PEP-CTERM system associated)